MTSIKTKKMLSKAGYYIFVSLLAFAMCYPLIWMLCSSFKETNTIFATATSLIPDPFVLKNYPNGWKGFGGISFATFFKNSGFVTVRLCTHSFSRQQNMVQLYAALDDDTVSGVDGPAIYDV